MIIHQIIDLILSMEEILGMKIDPEDHDIHENSDQDGIWISLPGNNWEFQDLYYHDSHDQELYRISHPHFIWMDLFDESDLHPEDSILYYKTHSELMIKISHPSPGMNNLDDLFIEFYLHPDQGEMKIYEKIGERG